MVAEHGRHRPGQRRLKANAPIEYTSPPASNKAKATAPNSANKVGQDRQGCPTDPHVEGAQTHRGAMTRPPGPFQVPLASACVLRAVLVSPPP